MADTRFKVDVTVTYTYFVDAPSHPDAVAQAIDFQRGGAREAYRSQPEATAEVCAEAA
jgi:hypothetical protein